MESALIQWLRVTGALLFARSRGSCLNMRPKTGYSNFFRETLHMFMQWSKRAIAILAFTYGGTSKFRGNQNFGVTFYLTVSHSVGGFVKLFQVSWWPLECVWKWYRNHISNLLFWIAIRVFLSGDTFFRQNGPNTWWNFQSKTKIEQKHTFSGTIICKQHFATANALMVSHVTS